MRGFGRTRPSREIDKYILLHLVGDVVGLPDALGVETAVIAGHDWGAPVAWQAALLRPDRFNGVIGLSVRFMPRGQVRPTTTMPENDNSLFYQLYFHPPDVPETEFERDVRRTIQKILYSALGDAPTYPATLGEHHIRHRRHACGVADRRRPLASPAPRRRPQFRHHAAAPPPSGRRHNRRSRPCDHSI